MPLTPEERAAIDAWVTRTVAAVPPPSDEVCRAVGDVVASVIIRERLARRAAKSAS